MQERRERRRKRHFQCSWFYYIPHPFAIRPPFCNNTLLKTGHTLLYFTTLLASLTIRHYHQLFNADYCTVVLGKSNRRRKRSPPVRFPTSPYYFQFEKKREKAEELLLTFSIFSSSDAPQLSLWQGRSIVLRLLAYVFVHFILCSLLLHSGYWLHYPADTDSC